MTCISPIEGVPARALESVRLIAFGLPPDSVEHLAEQARRQPQHPEDLRDEAGPLLHSGADDAGETREGRRDVLQRRVDRLLQLRAERAGRARGIGLHDQATISESGDAVLSE
jgi:hypothetical protein